MANDIANKNVGNETPEDFSEKKTAESAESKEKKSKDKVKSKDGKSKKTSKKPKKGIVKYFKDAKSEFKKVVWPTPKSTTNNTIIVIVVCLLAAAFIFGVDSLFGLINRLILGS